MEIKSLLASAEAHEGWLRERLQALVEVESPSEDPAGVNAAGALVEGWARELGGRVKRHKQKEFGDLLELRFGPSRALKKPLLILGHLDTVWSRGTLAKMPWREADGRLWGPGVLDMKFGVVQALAAIKILKEKKLLPPVTLLLVSEEEVGSPVSRPVTERLALESSHVFVLEPAQGLAYKTARKGVGAYTLKVAGVASHAGVDFTRGHSAILEAARLVEKVSAFTDLSRGLTVNCGVFTGGTRLNVVAAEAVVEVDVRIARARDAAYVEKLFRSLKVTDPACRLEVTGGINRPPMERKPGTVRLYKQARKLAAGLGFVLDEAATGGGSDGNFTAGLGVPTLDGMGAVGEGAHAPHEHIVVEHIVPRLALLAGMIAS
ncbi:M20 family metallopeptidase [Granulicella rosea]|uniref:M20 family metallopeptidase n=1 Tax=Granulicella rosea TaxID=474952 RepID=UPI000B77AFD5|nr:M20 family metallopeptidase [Granulicella rosea]